MRRSTIALTLCGLLGILLLGVCGSNHSKDNEVQRCDAATSRLVAKAYIASVPLISEEDELSELLEANPRPFTKDGPATRCMESLGRRLISMVGNSMNSNPHAAQERFGGSMPKGLEHVPGQVDASMRRAGVELYSMGEELIWLGRVLPAAVEGDWTNYRNTGTHSRNIAKMALDTLQTTCAIETGCQYMMAELQEVKPELERGLFMLIHHLSK